MKDFEPDIFRLFGSGSPPWLWENLSLSKNVLSTRMCWLLKTSEEGILSLPLKLLKREERDSTLTPQRQPLANTRARMGRSPGPGDRTFELS